MSIHLSNAPEGLRKLMPDGYVPDDADLVVLDRKALDAAKSKFDGSVAEVLLLQAFTRALGTEAIALNIAELPEPLQGPASTLGKDGALLGQAVIDALEAPLELDEVARAALPELADLLHEQMGKEELLKGTLSNGLPASRATEAQLGQWFAAGVADLRASADGKPIEPAGAQKLIKLTKQVFINRGGGLVTRAFFDGAVQDLHATPGLGDEALELLNTFRLQTQPGRTAHRRTDHGALVRIDAAKRKDTELGLLNETQAKAIAVSTERAAAKGEAAHAKLLAAIEPWGFGEADLEAVKLYVERYAPLTIQFNPDKSLKDGTTVLDGLLDDPFYKNQFQTKISSGALCPTSGSSRDNWEKEIFDGVYHDHELVPEERPKYGGLSGLNSPKGNGGDGYGKCFFELRHDVKWRTTFTPGNSSGRKKDDVTTIETLDLLLQQILEKDQTYLKHLFEIAKGDKTSVDKRINCSYIEAQIHGDCDLTRDVDFLVVHSSYLTTPYGPKLLELAAKIGATVKFTDHSKFYLHEPD